MEVDLAVLADAANVTGNGKLNVLGVFDRFTLGPDFPAPTPSFAFVMRIVAHPSEVGRHGFTVRLADADGKEVAKLDGKFQIEKPKQAAKPTRALIILPSQLKLPGPGEYAFDILLDGRWEKSIPLEVVVAGRRRA